VLVALMGVNHVAGAGGANSILGYAIATALGALFVYLGKVFVNWLKSRKDELRHDSEDSKTLSEFFFGVQRDVRTGTPGRRGWTTTVDETLIKLQRGQEQTLGLVREVLSELRPDNNGGHNFRGRIDRIEENLRQDGDKDD